MRPHIFLTQESQSGLRSVDDANRAAGRGHGRRLFERLVHAADAAVGRAPYLPTTRVPGRDSDSTRHANPDFIIVQTAAECLLSTALVALLKGEVAYRDAALRQAEALFDPDRWPDWRDQAHRAVAADLRTGQLSQAAGLAYDWLHPMLDSDQRRWFVSGLDRAGIRPYLQGVAEEAWWLTRQNNWLACVVGGLGVCGMALGDDHPEAQTLVDLSLERMRRYLAVYGPLGEFNENVAYAGATRLPVTYFAAHRYHTGDGTNLLAAHPFPQTCRWYMHFFSPPDRMAAFGDAHPDAPPQTGHLAAVAAAADDGLLQWFYLNAPSNPQSESPALEFLAYDDRLEPYPPKNQMPLGQAYPGHHGCISSRSSWDMQAPASVVFAKAGHGAEGHGHHDAGQLTLDGLGRRLIVDLGSPSMYPADFFGENRYRYYNASVRGHNVLMFDEEESAVGADSQARIVASAFDAAGATWSLDLTGIYPGTQAVYRHVVHLNPWVVAVLDEARLPLQRAISLRWHTADRAAPDADGCFAVEADGVRLEALIAALGDGPPITLSSGEHRYTPPFDRGRLGDPLLQKEESYVEARAHADGIRLLTLFAVMPPEAPAGRWRTDGGTWRIDLGATAVTVTWDPQEGLHLSEDSAGSGLTNPLPT